jgi:diguanylate cyclase (GGDEF)-like protein
VSTVITLAATAALGYLVGRYAAERQIRRLHHLLRLAHHTAGHDQLTALPNRPCAAQIFTRRALRAQPTVVVLIDLDRFKQVNDTYGHHVGDDLLRTIAGRLTAAGRTHNGIAARLSGDEFLLLLPAHAGHDPADTVEQILRRLAAPTLLHTADGIITVEPRASAGIAVYDGSHGTFNTLLYQADIALFHAKQEPSHHHTYHPHLRMPRNAGRHGPRLREHRRTDGAQPDETGGQLGSQTSGEVTE